MALVSSTSTRAARIVSPAVDSMECVNVLPPVSDSVPLTTTGMSAVTRALFRSRMSSNT